MKKQVLMVIFFTILVVGIFFSGNVVAEENTPATTESVKIYLDTLESFIDYMGDNLSLTPNRKCYWDYRLEIAIIPIAEERGSGFSLKVSGYAIAFGSGSRTIPVYLNLRDVNGNAIIREKVYIRLADATGIAVRTRGFGIGFESGYRGLDLSSIAAAMKKWQFPQYQVGQTIKIRWDNPPSEQEKNLDWGIFAKNSSARYARLELIKIEGGICTFVITEVLKDFKTISDKRIGHT